MEPGENPARASAICSSAVPLITRTDEYLLTSVRLRSCGQNWLTSPAVMNATMIRDSQCLVQCVCCGDLRLLDFEARLDVGFFGTAKRIRELEISR